MTHIVEVRTGSRLHFGLLSFGQPACRQYGGAGVMLAGPQTIIRAEPASRWSTQGPASQRVLEVAQQVQASLPSGVPTQPLALTVVSAAPRHHGLGSGTQLALATAAAVWAQAAPEGPPREPADWARLTQRAQRSAIGLFGFLRGGLLVEGGKGPDQTLSPLLARLEWPTDWPWLLVRPLGRPGLSGAEERRAFAQLPPVPLTVTAELCRILLTEFLPAVADREFAAASDALYRYGQLAGTCFKNAQGDVYATPLVRRVADALTTAGVRGVGQSSWGPTVFAMLNGPAEAAVVRARLHEQLDDLDVVIDVVGPRNEPFHLDRSPRQ